MGKKKPSPALQFALERANSLLALIDNEPKADPEAEARRISRNASLRTGALYEEMAGRSAEASAVEAKRREHLKRRGMELNAGKLSAEETQKRINRSILEWLTAGFSSAGFSQEWAKKLRRSAEEVAGVFFRNPDLYRDPRGDPMPKLGMGTLRTKIGKAKKSPEVEAILKKLK